MTNRFNNLYKIIIENNNYPGNGYKFLATLGMYPGKKYNFIQEVKKWYIKNTQLSPEEIDVTLQAKIQNALKDNSLYFQKLKNFDQSFLLAHPQEFDIEIGNDEPEQRENMYAAYLHADKKLLINPYMVFSNINDLIQTVLHELMHSIQQVGNPWNREDSSNKIQSLFHPNTQTYTYEGDPNIIKGVKNSNITDYGVKYYTRPAELDTILGEVNRAIAKIKNVLIYPNDINTAEKELRFILDPNNWNQIPNEFKDNVKILRTIITGEGKEVPNSIQEQNRLIKIIAQRMSLLAKNVPKNKQVRVA